MVSAVRNSYNIGRKSLLVAHSQGNFYANQTVNYLQSFHPDVAACVGIVGVATPATYVANNGLYETRIDDQVIQYARTNFSWGLRVLPPTMSAQSTGDFLGHNFVESYLTPLSVRNQLRADIVAQTSVANSACLLNCAPTGFDPSVAACCANCRRD